jgi:hypothetical protein
MASPAQASKQSHSKQSFDRACRAGESHRPKISKSRAADVSAIDHAVRIIYWVCCLGGAADLLDELQGEGIASAIRRRDTATLFDWLSAALSYQGISDQVAANYMAEHGQAEWHDINRKMAAPPSCPKLRTYWQFHGCGYHKISRTCAEPDHIENCPVPSHDLRNGRLNQTAYSLYLFSRDLADSDLVGMIAIDTLVHNLLHRTGILSRFGVEHGYGAACYQPGKCADVIYRVAQQIDARAFNPAFPAIFPRFVQHAIWRFCAQNGLGVCNGNRIDDRKSCGNTTVKFAHYAIEYR